MNRCLFCGKAFQDDPLHNQWHQQCSKKFFGTGLPPLVSLSKHNLESIANKAIDKGNTSYWSAKEAIIDTLNRKGSTTTPH